MLNLSLEAQVVNRLQYCEFAITRGRRGSADRLAATFTLSYNTCNHWQALAIPAWTRPCNGTLISSRSVRSLAPQYTEVPGPKPRPGHASRCGPGACCSSGSSIGSSSSSSTRSEILTGKALRCRGRPARDVSNRAGDVFCGSLLRQAGGTASYCFRFVVQACGSRTGADSWLRRRCR